MSVVSDAFEAACADPADYQPLADLISEHSGTPVSPEWVEAALELAMPIIWVAAPCKVEEWQTFCQIPPVLQPVIFALIVRTAVTPVGGIRTIQLGEFSQTWQDSGSQLTGSEIDLIGQIAGCGRRGGLTSVRAFVDPPTPGWSEYADFDATQPPVRDES